MVRTRKIMNDDIKPPNSSVSGPGIDGSLPPEDDDEPKIVHGDGGFSEEYIAAGKKKKRFDFSNLTKKQKWLLIIGVIIILIGLGIGAHFIFKSSSKTAKKPVAAIVKTPAVTPKPVVITSRLTGIPVTQAQSVLPVTAVMIENSLDARPQSGLGDAGIVFEALAEGGITRFMALYEEENPGSLGPVRSARPYFIDWMLPFDAGYAHDGGSPTALAQITADSVRDLNEAYNGGSYTRISSREAPHNLYTSMAALLALEQSKGYTTSTFTGFPRKAAQPAKTPTAATISMHLSSSDYNPSYTYNAATNTYERDEAGAPQVDANTGLQIDPNVVIAMIVPWTDGALDSSDAYYTVYSDIGSGSVDIFQDGTVTVGTWTKSSPTSQIQFLSSTGQPIDLDPGQTWITAIDSASDLTYAP